MGLSAGPPWLPGQAQAGEDTRGSTRDTGYWVNFASTSTFSPLPPPSLHTPSDSLEAEMTQGFLVIPTGEPSGKCFLWQGVILRRPTAAPEIRVETEQMGRGEWGHVAQSASSALGLVRQGRLPFRGFVRGGPGTEAGDTPKTSPEGNVPRNPRGSFAASTSETSSLDHFQLFQARCPG